ncbi:MAG: DUF2807 domain-containing protein [Crocinitomicaceae bacterium]|nr:DUF2807 domain-containing protein [Crocinitomicaceae bacterium]
MKVQFLVIAIASLLITSCSKEKVKPSDTITSVERNITGFNEVVVSDAIEADVTFSTTEENVVVEANSNIHEYIITEVISGVLHIRRKENVHFKSPATIRIHITALSLNDISVSGASSFSILNDLVATNATINVSGASRISGGLITDNCSFNLSGASSGQFFGAIGNATMDLSGASSVGSLSLSVDNLNIDLSGASDAVLGVNETIDIIASGASTLDYLGDAVITSTNLSGGSSVNKL